MPSAAMCEEDDWFREVTLAADTLKVRLTSGLSSGAGGPPPEPTSIGGVEPPAISASDNSGEGVGGSSGADLAAAGFDSSTTPGLSAVSDHPKGVNPADSSTPQGEEVAESGRASPPYSGDGEVPAGGGAGITTIDGRVPAATAYLEVSVATWSALQSWPVVGACLPDDPQAIAEITAWFVQNDPDEDTFCTGYFADELDGHVLSLHERAV